MAGFSCSSRVFASDLLLLLEPLSSSCFPFLLHFVSLAHTVWSVSLHLCTSHELAVSLSSLEEHFRVVASRIALQLLLFSVDLDSKLFSSSHLLPVRDCSTSPASSHPSSFVFVRSCLLAFTPPPLSPPRQVNHQLWCLAVLTWLTIMVLHGGPTSSRTLVCSWTPYQSAMSHLSASWSSMFVLLQHGHFFRQYRHGILPTMRLATACHHANNHQCVCTALRTQLVSGCSHTATSLLSCFPWLSLNSAAHSSAIYVPLRFVTLPVDIAKPHFPPVVNRRLARVVTSFATLFRDPDQLSVHNCG